SNEGTQTLPDDQKPVALLCIGCVLIASSLLLFLKSVWKACYKTSKFPKKTTVALFVASTSAAILTIVAMPHLDIVTNVTILNGIAILSALLQIIAQCMAKERNRFLLPSITAFILILLGYTLFLTLYIMKNPSDTKMALWVGLAVGGSLLVSFNWWENYIRVISEHSKSIFIQVFYKDMRRCENMLNIFSSLLRIIVTACVLGAYVPLAKMDWDVVTSIPRRQTRIISIIIGVQLVSSALCHWFSLSACKMHALRRCFILPLYLASLSVMVLFIVPVIVYYQDYRISLNGTSTNFTNYCSVVVDGRNTNLNVFSINIYLWLNFPLYLGLWSSGSAVSWWLGLVLATLHLWYLTVYRIERTQDLFIRRLYEGAFIEQSLLLNTRFDIQKRKKKRIHKASEPAMIYLCATMWHETYDEMMNIIISIFRLDKYRPKKDAKVKDFTFDTHIYFDDAFENVEGQGRHLNEYAKTLVNVLAEVYRKLEKIPDQKVIRTPYGGRLVITMPHGNQITVHFKDKELIRHKKRWSQVMYLYYLLGWKLMTKYYRRWDKGENEEDLKEQIQKEKHNTYLLALDGDTDFQPAAVMLLVDRLKMYPRVGAACGRIHPTGSGPAVWFQKFEYAISHWLQKTAEHMIGCVLCSPGCFSLFRAEALMDDNVMKRYSTKSSEASHYVQYDQGEDRWLCTLLLKQGWRVEYNAASDAYTNAPEEFKELYNQRRRWGPSTMANVADLLGATTAICKRNSSMSKPFMFYQLFNMISAILAPATICLLIAGSLTFVLKINASLALVLAVVPPAIYLGLCFKLKPDTQITIAAILSIIYAFLMLVVTMAIVGSMVADQTILTPSGIFIVAMTIIYIFTAVMHPQEAVLVFYGFLYIICIPSAYLLLTIYSMTNLNNVSWGTRETKPDPKTVQAVAAAPQMTTQKVVLLLAEHLKEFVSLQDEEVFWTELQKKYLEPLVNDKDKQKKMSEELKNLRNKINFAFFMVNALWLVATFTLQTFEDTFSIKIPKVNLQLEVTGDITIDPIGFMFILGFALSVAIQFFTMLIHRMSTLIHYVAFLGTEPLEKKPEKDTYRKGKKVITTKITSTIVILQ
uniref:chitin synthase n=1 Tax=Sphaeramia orbicularis TaxID=375764 RepID=A0A672Z9U3_9TELE